MRQVSALDSTWERRARDSWPGPESVAAGRLFCLSLAPRALPRRPAARISVSVPCFVACDSLPHSPRYVGGRPSGPHSQLSPASLTPSSRLGAVPGRLPQLGVSACAGTWRSRFARSPRWNRLGSDVAATRGQAQSPWLQADFSASLSLLAPSRGALLSGSRSPCLASLPVTLCRTLRAMLAGDPRDRIRSSCSGKTQHHHGARAYPRGRIRFVGSTRFRAAPAPLPRRSRVASAPHAFGSEARPRSANAPPIQLRFSSTSIGGE
jgi:hypothetical protein